MLVRLLHLEHLARAGEGIAPLARRAGHPLLLSLVCIAIVATVRLGLPLGPAALTILVGALGYLFAMEVLIPFREGWRPSAREWRRDALYFCLNGGVSLLVGAGVGLLAIGLARDRSGLALVAEVPLGFLLASTVGYWTHRLGHAVPALWQLHGIHHAPTKVNSWNNNVFHFADLVLQSAPPLALLVLLGSSAEAVFAITSFGQVLGFVDHANADFRVGRLNYVVGSPEQHRLHHSTRLEEAGHYSVLPLIDLAFGTFTWRPGRTPARVGLGEGETFPDPDSILAGAMHPVRAWRRRRGGSAAAPGLPE